MTTDEIIKKLCIEPVAQITNGSLYTHSDLDRIVTELSAGYEAQIKVLRDALEELACLGNGDRHGNSIGNSIAIRAISQSSPLAALENDE
jgi:hypothetical protein